MSTIPNFHSIFELQIATPVAQNALQLQLQLYQNRCSIKQRNAHPYRSPSSSSKRGSNSSVVVNIRRRRSSYCLSKRLIGISIGNNNNKKLQLSSTGGSKITITATPNHNAIAPNSLQL